MPGVSPPEKTRRTEDGLVMIGPRKEPGAGDERKNSRSAGAGVNYELLSSRPVDDRVEQAQEQPVRSSTYDALLRLSAGLPERTIADKLSDPNRPTWETWAAENAHRLEGADEKTMRSYRRELDEHREAALEQRRKKRKKDDSSDDDDNKKKKKKKKHKKQKKKHSKKKDKEKPLSEKTRSPLPRDKKRDSDSSENNESDESNERR